MRWAPRILANARQQAIGFRRQMRPHGTIRWCLNPSTDIKPLSPEHDTLPSLSEQWKQENFWIKGIEASGFPLLICYTRSDAEAWCAAIKARGVEVRLACDSTELRDALFRGVCVYCGPLTPGMWAFNENMEPDEELLDWLDKPQALGCAHSDAYTKFRTSRSGWTEDVLGKLGYWVWGDLEVLLDQIETPAEFSAEKEEVFSNLCRQLDQDENVAALVELDKLTNRDIKYKRRHYIDICTLHRICARVWEEESKDGILFRRVARIMLYEALRANMDYERMMMTMFWLWTNPYWQDLCKYVLSTRLLHSTEKHYRLVCKETTAQVTASFMFPLTNTQHIASMYFLNAEDLLGFSDQAEMDHSVALEIVEFALDRFEYTYPAEEGRDFDAYLAAFAEGAYTLLEPIYRKFGAEVRAKEDVIRTRTAWASGGVSGRRARDVLGSVAAPHGSSKAFVFTENEASAFEMDWGDTWVELARKMDERGRTLRTLSATDMRDQFLEKVCFRPITNRYPMVGMDIGESPIQALQRHVKLTGASVRRSGYIKDGKVLVAWDWSQWDHYFLNAEKVIVLQRMRDLTRRFVPGAIGAELCDDLDKLIASHRTMVFRSQDFADATYGKMLDDLIREHPGLAERLTGRHGQTAVRVQQPNGQQSGRFTTLDGNTIVGTTRLLVRDAEILQKRPHLRHRTALLTFNRADDVADVFDAYYKGVEAVNTMLRQGHKANPKKQVIQHGSVVYLRNLYAGGSVRAFPPRATFAAVTSHPEKGAGSDVAFYDKLRSASKGLDMWMRRGGFWRMARAIYDDIEGFFCWTRVWKHGAHGKPYSVRVKISRAVIRAAPVNGGLGVLPPGVYTYDYSVKCETKPAYKEAARRWEAKVTKRENKMKAYGVTDLEQVGRRWLMESTGLAVTSRQKRQFESRWRGSRVHQDGSGETRKYHRYALTARCVKRSHVDTVDSKFSYPSEEMEVLRCSAVLREALRLATIKPGDLYVDRYLAENLKALPAAGMTEHLWHGYGAVLLAEVRGDIYATEKLLARLAQGSNLGIEFFRRTSHWSTQARADHLAGNLGIEGGWDKIIPPSWTGWLKMTVSRALEHALWYNPQFSRGRYRLVKLRARLTELAASSLLVGMPQLCLH